MRVHLLGVEFDASKCGHRSQVRSDGRYFTPFADRPPRDELRLDMRPKIDAIELFLARVFLRRHVLRWAGTLRRDEQRGAATRPATRNGSIEESRNPVARVGSYARELACLDRSNERAPLRVRQVLHVAGSSCRDRVCASLTIVAV